MIIYISGAILSIICAYISAHVGQTVHLANKGKSILPELFGFLSFLPLTLISAFRYDVGADFMNYVKMYKSQTFKESEPGFALLAKTLYLISHNPQILFIVTSVLICAFYYIAIYRESISPAYSIFIFFTTATCYFNSMNLLRQNMAMGLFLLALSFYRKGECKRYILFVIIAASVHNSALFAALAILAIDLLKITPIKGVLIIVISAAFARVFSTIVRQFIISYTTYGGYFYDSEANTYLSIVIVLICFYILFSYIYDKVSTRKSIHIAFSALIYGLVIGSSVSTIFIPANRLMYYSESILVLYVPEAIKVISRRYVRYIVYVAVTAAYLLKLIIFFNSSYYQITTQYKTMWG